MKKQKECVCEICGKVFHNHGRFYLHIQKDHKMNSLDYEIKYHNLEIPLCPICGKPCRHSSGIGFYTTCGDKNCTKENKKRKTKETCIRKYGTEYTFQAEEVKKSIKESMIKKYGVDNISKLESNKEKIRNAWKGHTEERKREIAEKARNTSLIRYGTNSPNSSEMIKKKKEDACLEKYGVTNPNKLQSVRDKIRNTCIERFDGRLWNHKYKRYRFDGHTFDSSWELKFYIFLKDNGIAFEYHPRENLTYFTNDGKKHYYEVDFKVGDQLIEVKGDHCFTKNGELLNPFGNYDLLLEKQKCMEENNVLIYTSKELKDAFEHFDSKGYKLTDFERNK